MFMKMTVRLYTHMVHSPNARIPQLGVFLTPHSPTSGVSYHGFTTRYATKTSFPTTVVGVTSSPTSDVSEPLLSCSLSHIHIYTALSSGCPTTSLTYRIVHWCCDTGLCADSADRAPGHLHHHGLEHRHLRHQHHHLARPGLQPQRVPPSIRRGDGARHVQLAECPLSPARRVDHRYDTTT